MSNQMVQNICRGKVCCKNYRVNVGIFGQNILRIPKILLIPTRLIIKEYHGTQLCLRICWLNKNSTITSNQINVKHLDINCGRWRGVFVLLDTEVVFFCFGVVKDIWFFWPWDSKGATWENFCRHSFLATPMLNFSDVIHLMLHLKIFGSYDKFMC